MPRIKDLQSKFTKFPGGGPPDPPPRGITPPGVHMRRLARISAGNTGIGFCSTWPYYVMAMYCYDSISLLSPIYNSLSATRCAIRHRTLWGNRRLLAVARPCKPTQVLIAKVEFGLTFAIHRGDEGENIHSNHVLATWLLLICWWLPCTSGCGWKITKKVACSAGLLSLSAILGSVCAICFCFIVNL